MEVATLEQFQRLERKVEALESAMSRMMNARVTVEWVSIEVSEIILGVSRSTIYQMRKANKLAFRQMNRKVKISLSSIRRYADENSYDPLAVEARISSLLAA